MRPECPIHATWECDGCGHVRQGVNHLLNARTDRVDWCVRCGGFDGTYRQTKHHDMNRTRRCVEEWRAWRAQTPVALTPFDRDHITSLDKFLCDLAEPRMHYRQNFNRAQQSATGSEAWNDAVNQGNAALYVVERLMRAWVAEHPGEDTCGALTDAVAKLHPRNVNGFCGTCQVPGSYDESELWPCPTLRAHGIVKV